MKRALMLIGMIGMLAGFSDSIAAERTQPTERLRTAMNAEHRVTLQGTMNTVTFFADGSVSSEVKVYRKAGKSRWEYQAKALRGMVLIEKGDQVIRLDPATKTAYVGRTESESSLVGTLLKNYTATQENQEKLLRRTVDVISVRSRYAGRPFRKVWIDRATNLILRSEYYNSEGKLSSLTFYTAITWNPRLDDSLFDIPAGWTRVATTDESQRHWSQKSLSAEVKFAVREPTYRPPGFVLDGFHLYRCRCGAASAHLRYVDGLTSFSVFEKFSKCPGGCRERGFRWGLRRRAGQNGEMFDNNQGKMLVKPLGDLTFILVGDLTPQELQKIADSIR